MQPEPWAESTWGFWWIFPVIWSVICFFFVIVMARMASGARFKRIRPHHEDREEAARLSHEVEEMHEEVDEHDTQSVKQALMY